MSVLRCYSEKRPGFDVEARQLLRDLSSLLGVSALTGVRYLCRYDVEGIDGDAYEAAKHIVFSVREESATTRLVRIGSSPRSTHSTEA